MRAQTQFINYDHNIGKNEQFGGRHGQSKNLRNPDILGSKGSNFQTVKNNDIMEEPDESQEDIHDDQISKDPPIK